MKEIATAFIKAQSEMSAPKKDNSNPFFKSKYADLNSVLEAVMKPLHNNGIAVLQPTICIDGKNYVKTILLHESGQTLESFTEILYAKVNDAQGQGSGITYARRYGLQSLCGVGAEDDDGNKASAPVKIPTLTEDQFNKTMQSDIKGLHATLKAIKDGKILATQVQVLAIETEILNVA